MPAWHWACCCGDPCGYCTGATPKTVTMEVATDITECSGATDPACLTSVAKTLQQEAGTPCAYKTTHTCGGETWNYHFEFTSAATYIMAIWYNDGVTNVVSYAYVGTFASGDCDSINETVANDHQIGDPSYDCADASPFGGEIVGTGGTVTVNTT